MREKASLADDGDLLHADPHGSIPLSVMDGEEIFIVDDDQTFGEILNVAFSAEGFRVTNFHDGEEFCEVLRSRTPPACIILDVMLPGRSGLDVLKTVDASRYNAPFIVMSGVADIRMAIEAIKRGAFDFIEKPFTIEGIVDRVRKITVAWTRHRAALRNLEILAAIAADREPLTQREMEVLAEITAAATNKEAARHLGISPRTVEVHRAHIMDKLGAKNAADLVRIVFNQRRPALSTGSREL